MKQKTIKMINKIKRWFRINEPETLLKWIQTAPSEYDKDRALVNRMNYYVDYAKRY